MDTERKILVTGAAGNHGAVGRKIVQLLLERGLPVRAMDGMSRILAVLAIGIALGVGGMSFAQHKHDAEDGESVKLLSALEIREKLDGKDAKVSFVEVTIEPGKAGLPHRHPGPGFVYVIEGEYELGVDDQPTRIVKAGETFYEPTGCLHRVSKNPSATKRTRLIAVVVHPRDAKEVAVPEKAKK